MTLLRGGPALQRLAVPLAADRGSLVGALQECRQFSFRRDGGAHVVIHQDELLHLRMIESCFGADRLLGKAWRFRRSVGIKRRTFDVASAGPEACTADLVRIGFARDGFGAGALRSRPSGEARHREIEASPEKMHRADLADEARPELLQ